MKKLYLLILIIFCFTYSSSYSVQDTISYWDKNQDGYSSYDGSQFQWQVAHFYTDAPCYIKQVIIYCSGNAGTAQLFISGQEAGSPYPLVTLFTNRASLVDNINVNAQPNNGVPNVINLDPPVYISGNQFYIGLINLSAGTKWLYDNQNKQSWCEYTEDGNLIQYTYQFRVNPQGGLEISSNSYLIDVIVDYPTKSPAYHFRDVTEDYEISLNLSRNSIAAADYNGDGYIDLLISGKIYRNTQGQYFEDVSSEIGLSGSPIANAIVDINNDGNLDILFLFQGAGTKSKIFINNGDGTFDEKTLSIPELKSVTCFSIADLNDDLLPDIFIGQLWEPLGIPQPNYLLLNNGQNDFADQTKILYPDYDGTYNYPNEVWDEQNCIYKRNRYSRGSQFADVDNDGDMDLYIANYWETLDEFFVNNGDGSFSDKTQNKNFDINTNNTHNNGTGVDWYDYDNDGDMDLLISRLTHPRNLPNDQIPTTIYKNEGSPGYNFTDTWDKENYRSTLDIGYEETTAGSAWGDINNDGLVDFIKTTYYGCRLIDLYQQKSDNTFENRTFEYGLEGIVTGEDACWLDFDNDGKLDLAMSVDRKFHLFKNYYDLNFDWLEVDLKGKEGQESHIIGARVKVYTDKGTYMQEVSCGRGQKMQKPTRLHFGLGKNASIDKIEVRWPGTTVYEEYYGINKNMIVTLIQDKGGEPEAPEPPILSLPFDGSTDINIKTDILKWNSVSGADRYHLQVSESDNFASPVIDIKDLIKTENPMIELKGEKKYFWRVASANFVGYGDWSEVWNFTTSKIIINTPDTPVLLSPEDGAINVNRNTAKMDWSEVANAGEYHLQVSENISFDPLTLDIDGLTLTDYHLSDLKVNSVYYWKVRAWNTAGYGDWSALRNFVTDNSVVGYPLPPVLLSPENTSQNVKQDAYMSWQSGQGATRYQLQVSTHFAISKDIVIDTIIRQTRYPVAELAGETIYYWQVFSINSRGKSEFPSSTSNFTTGVFSSVKELNIEAGKLYIDDPAPNPTASIAKFNIGIQERSNVKLEIFDLSGRIVEGIFSGILSPGTYRIEWDTRLANPGIYYIKLSAGNKVMTKKISVIK